MKINRILFIIITVFLCSACTANYNLDISDEGYKEKITIKATSQSENELFEKVEEPIYVGSEINNIDPTKKIEGTEYYDSNLTLKDGLSNLTYSHNFKRNKFSKSYAPNTAYETFIFRKYDHDLDGYDDYTMITTTETLYYFENNPELEEIIVNIKNHYKVISSNADYVKGRTYTWHITKDNIKAVNMVYDESETTDKGKITDNYTIAYFLIIIPLLLLFYISYKKFKKYSESKNKIPD